MYFSHSFCSDEWIIHGSGGNSSPRWRRTYVIAFRSEQTVAWERKLGFTHSHNDFVNWDTFDDYEN
jgi:phytanoyl-CoA hydroxylase